MYDLKQAALLAYEKLSSLLKEVDYIPIVRSLGMWKHKTRKTIFVSVFTTLGSSIILKKIFSILEMQLKNNTVAKLILLGAIFLALH